MHGDEMVLDPVEKAASIQDVRDGDSVRANLVVEGHLSGRQGGKASSLPSFGPPVGGRAATFRPQACSRRPVVGTSKEIGAPLVEEERIETLGKQQRQRYGCHKSADPKGYYTTRVNANSDQQNG